MLKSLLKRTNDLSALILRMLLRAVSIQHGPQRVLGRFGRLSVELRWEDSHARSQAVRSSRRRFQTVRTNFGRSKPDNDDPTLPPPLVGIWNLPWFLACFGAAIDEQKPALVLNCINERKNASSLADGPPFWSTRKGLRSGSSSR
jgi:hypothetical protein